MIEGIGKRSLRRPKCSTIGSSAPEEEEEKKLCFAA
jgi:hypothetical protein